MAAAPESIPALSPDETARRLVDILNAFLAETRGAGAPVVTAHLDSLLERDLGLDSLSRFELWLRVEQAFGVGVEEEKLAEIETARDLLRLLLAGSKRHAHAADVVQLTDRGVATVPESATTLLEALDWHVRAQGDRLHITILDGEREEARLTYADLARDMEAVAAGLQREGLEPGQAAAIMLPTGRDFFAAYYGVLRAGGVPVPIYPPFRLAQLADHVRRQAGILQSAVARVLVTVREAKPVGSLLRGQVPSLARIVTVDDLRAHAARPAPVAVKAEDIAFIQYTSGSTGNPKGVVLTHANLLANMRAMVRACGATSADIFVSWLPLYHDMGLIGAWLCPLYAGLPLVAMSPLHFLSRPARWLWAIHRYRGTISAGPNFAYELAASRIDERELEGLDLASWRWAFNGAEPVSADTMARFAARFARHGFDPASLAPVYGLAECALDLAFPPGRRGVLVDRIDRERLAAERVAVPAPEGAAHAVGIVACGRPLAGYEMRIADEAGRELPERHVGRLEFKGPSATSGYFNNPEATAKLFDAGWLDTGDLGYIAAGELYLTGRSKDMMIRGGQNVYPYELEEAVGAVPGIRKGCVAVFGVGDPASGTERIVVLAETRETDATKRAALTAQINALAADLIGGPADDVVLAPPHSVLKTSSGKIRRAASREVYERGLVGARRPALWRELTALALRAARGRVVQWWRGAVAVVYSAWVWGATAALATLAYALALVLPMAVARHVWRASARAAVWCAGLPVVVEGAAHLPGTGPVVVVANHASYVDGLLLFALLPSRFVFAAKEGFERNAFTRIAFRKAGAVFVERFDAGRSVEDTRRLAGLAKGGAALGIFPEGTFSRTPGLRPFRMGAFVVAAEADVPVVPVAFRGSRSVLRDGEWIFRRREVHAVFGAAIAPSGADWAAAVKLRDAARAHILEHCGEPDLADDRLA
jgi:1-acyl-sn-glycerol-3-phosphate acyltransferase